MNSRKNRTRPAFQFESLENRTVLSGSGHASAVAAIGQDLHQEHHRGNQVEVHSVHHRGLNGMNDNLVRHDVNDIDRNDRHGRNDGPGHQ